ncbi:MurR/RpiR family transcriptional regulator [Streptomyces sp. NPDC050433]|uniref:MurR/RpiR family transcriptional regulator n=1 Tax=Streptomyces sp. NPDC050433 TaxID=3365615 RepID=UPI0037A51175
MSGRIRQAMDSLPAGGRRIGRTVLANYPAAGLETTAVLAKRAGVSGPTVVRFVAHLGFAGYREFQSALRKELQARDASPLTLPSRFTDEVGLGEALREAGGVFRDDLDSTFSRLPASELERTLDLLTDSRARVACAGGRFSRLLAEYLELHLRQMRPGTRQVTPTADMAAADLLDVGRHDVFVLFDLRRYQQETIALAREARARRARIVLITDPWLSPVADLADTVLSAQVRSPSPFDSYVAAMALVEVIIGGVHQRLGEAATTRMRTFENQLEGLHQQGAAEIRAGRPAARGAGGRRRPAGTTASTDTNHE